MAEINPEETNRYLRIKRNDLMVDTNLSKLGSVTIDYDNSNSDLSSSLASRINLGNVSTNMAQGFCLLFDKNNPAAYIKTSIPSSEANQYDIIIKAHYGDILYVDTNFDTIIIRPKVDLRASGNALTNSFRCFVSYIYFRNKTSGKVAHLFECEERNGNILYDAITGETATLEGVSSLSALRNVSLQKEWIKDEEINLSNEVCLGGAHFQATNKLKFRDKLSVSFKLKLNPSSFFTDFNYTEFIYTILQTATTGNGFYINVGRIGSLVCGIKSTNASGTQETVQLSISDIVPVDNKFHDYVFIADATNGIIKFYIDSTLVGSQEGNIYPYEESSMATSILSNRAEANKDQNWSLKDLSIFNIDLSDSEAAYTITDFANNKQIPISLLSMSVDKFNRWDKTSTFNGSISGTQTPSADGKIITWDNYCSSVQNFPIYNPTAKSVKVAITPGCWINWTIKLDVYLTDTDGNPDYTNASISTFLIARAPSTNTYPTGRPYFGLFEKYQCIVTYEDTGELVYQTDGYISLSGTLSYDVTTLMRPIDSYQTSRPKIMKVRAKAVDQFWADEASSFGYFEINPIILRLNETRAITGTMELIDCYIEGCQVSYNNISDERQYTQLNSKWMDQTCNGDFLNLSAGASPSNPQFPCKQYGTWLSNVGYRNNNNTYIPRKVIP